MSSPASTPSRRGSKRGRSSNPQTPRTEDAQSPLLQKSRTDDSTSTGDLQPMPTSPAVDMQSPNAQDVLFSSPLQFWLRLSVVGAKC
uniref:Uncharacterized protein n=1 Tax=Gopherus agassizii TaxID=38772 RepID=A0A452IXP9_9SAUR